MVRRDTLFQYSERYLLLLQYSHGWIAGNVAAVPPVKFNLFFLSSDHGSMQIGKMVQTTPSTEFLGFLEGTVD